MTSTICFQQFNNHYGCINFSVFTKKLIGQDKLLSTFIKKFYQLTNWKYRIISRYGNYKCYRGLWGLTEEYLNFWTGKENSLEKGFLAKKHSGKSDLSTDFWSRDLYNSFWETREKGGGTAPFVPLLPSAPYYAQLRTAILVNQMVIL